MKNKTFRYFFVGGLVSLISGSFIASAQQTPTTVAPPSAAVVAPQNAAPVVRAPNPGQAPAVAAQPVGETLPNPYAPTTQPTQQQPAVVPPVQQVPAQQVAAQQLAQAPVGPPTALPPLPPYQQFVDQNFPASPQQIESLRRTVNGYQQVVAKPVEPAKPQTGSISVSLSPGSVPPKIRTYFGNTSSIVVVDSTGAPWPVQNFRLGNAAAFQLNRMDGGGGSSFALDANMPYAQGNLLLQLAGAQAPIVIEVVAGQPEYDARLEIRVQGRGPNAVGPTANFLPSAIDGRMLSVLDGVAPAGSKSLSVSYGGAQAWMLPSGRMLVRTPVKIVSPAPTTFVSSADGTHVYEFMPTSDLLGMSNGDFVNITVKGW
jgi:intracellular multiplication protein IcmK